MAFLKKNNHKSMKNNGLYMRRCFDLARLGKGKVNPNPMVGSLLLSGAKVIGEGWHKQFGGSHAEVNCFNSISPDYRGEVPNSTLFVSLEPCCFHGKTPACSDLIIKKKVKDLRISTIDKTPEVNGKGLEILKGKGVKIKTNILEEKGDWFVKSRTTFVTKKRPSSTAFLKDGSIPTWILGNGKEKSADSENLQYLKLPEGSSFLPSLFDRLVAANIDTLLVEGGATLLNSFIEAGYWDEARIFETERVLGHGISAPKLTGEMKVVEWIGKDRLVFRYNS